MVQIGYLNAKFDADVANFVKDMGRAADASEKTAKAITGAFKLMNNAMGALGVTLSAGAIFGKMLEESKQAESAAKKVEAVLRATGGAAGITAQQVDAVASSMSKLTGIDDDVIKGGQALLLTFEGIGKDVFPAATQAMLDMSETMGQDLKASAVQLGKALNDPKEGLSALQRIGVTFSESQKTVIKSLVDTGQTAKAQAIILQELQSEMGGTAAAARDTLEGALKALDTSFGNLFETLGSTGAFDLTRTAIEALVVGVDALSDALASNDFKQWLNGIQSAMDQAYQYVKPLLNALINVVDLLSKMPKNPVEFGERLGKALSGKMKPEDILGFNLKDIGKDYLGNFESKVLGGIEQMHERAKKAGSHVGKAVADGFSDALTKAKKEKSKGWLLSSDADLFNDKGRPSNGWLNKESADNLLFTDQSFDKLKDINAQLEEELEKQKLITAGNKEQLLHLEAQRKLKDIIFSSDAERAKAEQHIVDLMKAQNDLQAEANAKDALKTMQETNDALAAKVNGLEDEYEAYKKVQDITKDIEDPVKKQAYIDKVRDQINQEKAYKDQLDLQKKTLDEIKNSAGGYLQKQNELYKAWQSGTINGKQYAQTLEEIRKKQIETVQKGVKDFTMHIFDSFSKAIMEGKKLKDVFKDLGKELALLAAKKLLFEPMSNAIGNLAAKWYGDTIFGTPGGGGGNNNGTGGGGAGGGLGGITGWFKNLFGGGSKKGGGATPGGGKDPTWASGGGDKLTLLTDAVIGIRNTLDFVKISTSSGLALKVWEAHLGMPVDNKQPTTFKNPFRSANNGGSSGSSGGLTVNADALVPLIQSLIGSSKDGPAWKVIMPDCPCGTGLAGTAPGNIGGLMPSGGLGGPMPFNNAANEAARAAAASSANAAQMALGFGRTAAATNTGNQYLSSQQTQLYMRGLADQSNRNLTAGYQAGNVSYAQLQNYQGAWSNALATQAAMNYSATPNWLKGLNGGNFNFAGGTGIVGTQLNMGEDVQSDFRPGLTGGVNKTLMYDGWNPGGGSGGIIREYSPSPSVQPKGMLTPKYDWSLNNSNAWTRGFINNAPSPTANIYGLNDNDFLTPNSSSGSSGGMLPFTGIADPNPLNATKARWGMTPNPILNPNPQAAPATNPYPDFAAPKNLPQTGPNSNFGNFYQDMINKAGKFANGGDPPLGIPSLVGERGPELFVPKQSGTVLPHDRLKEIMGGGAAPVVNLHDYTSTASQISSTTTGADGSLHITLRDAVAGMMADPKVLRAQQRATGVKARGNRRGN